MRLNRGLGIPLFVTLGALLIYFTFPLMVQGTNSLLNFIVGGIFILFALPQMLWWAVGVTVLVFWGLRVFINLEMSRLSKPRKKEGQPYDHDYHGRFREIQQSLSRARSGRYSQGEVRNIFRSLAIDLIALKLDIPEEEARQRFHQGDWTEDRALKAYFSEELIWEEEERGLWRRFRRVKAPAFLEETQETLGRLKSYSNFSNGGKKFDLVNPNN